jgi:hypothetical protein
VHTACVCTERDINTVVQVRVLPRTHCGEKDCVKRAIKQESAAFWREDVCFL